MRLKCPHCNNKHDGTIHYTENGWQSLCPICDLPFNVPVPEGKILMLFAGWDTEFGKGFEDNHLKNEIYSYRAFNSVRTFMNRWRKVAEDPDSMWYWVIDMDDKGPFHYVTTGACSWDGDREIFKGYWGKLS